MKLKEHKKRMIERVNIDEGECDINEEKLRKKTMRDSGVRV